MKKLNIHPNAKALIFDIDGTLADTMPFFFQAWRNILQSYGVVLNPENFETHAGIPLKQSVLLFNEKFGLNLDLKATGKQIEKEVFEHIHLVKPIQPVYDLVKQYAGKMPMGLGTGGQRRNAWTTIEALGLGPYFEILVAAEDVENPKPAPDTFLLCAEKMGVDPHVCQVFEDGTRGLKAAEMAGMISTDVTAFYESSIGKEVY